MVIYRAAGALALWALVFGIASLSYIFSVREMALDNRIVWVFPICIGATLLGYLVAEGLARAGARGDATSRPRLGADRHGLILLVTFLCVLGMSHVHPNFSLITIRDWVPPNLIWIYPTLSFLAPIWVRRTAATVDAAEQSLSIAIGVTLMSGALFVLPAHAALGLGLITLLMQLRAGAHRIPLTPLSALIAVTGLLFVIAAFTARSRYFAEPSMAWFGSAFCICVAIALRPRDGGAWVRLLAIPVFIASIVALCDVLVTFELASRITLKSALDTRLNLFRQHPNFLAPCFVFHAVLAIGLGLSRARYAWLAWPAVALLLFATWHTDSNTGMASLAGGLALIPALFVLRFIWRSFGPRRTAIGLIAVLLMGVVGGALVVRSDAGIRKLTTSIDRFEKSVDYRADAWSNSLKTIKAYPWLGVGPHNFIALERFTPGSRFANEAVAPHPHNMLLYVTQSAGLFAILVVGLWLAILFIRLLLDAMSSEAREVPGVLLIALLAACASLLVANQFDLGLALDTVVPLPFFIVAGLLMARGAAGRQPPPLAHGLLVVAVCLVVALPFVINPIRAKILVRRAQVLAFEHAYQADPDATLEAAKAALGRAIQLSPVVEEAHRLLAMLQETTPEAEQTIRSFIEVNPDMRIAHSLLGTFYRDREEYLEAADAFHAAVMAPGGGAGLNLDRAREIICLTNKGYVKRAQKRLAEAIRLDRGVVNLIPWTVLPDARWVLPVGLPEISMTGKVSELSLFDAIQTVLIQHYDDEKAGRSVGRRFWLDTIHLIRDTRQLTLASEVLDYVEKNVEEVEAHTVAEERAKVALESGRFDEAVALYEKAYELSNNQSYLSRAQQLLRERNATGKIRDLSQQEVDLAQIGDMAAMTEAYRVELEGRSSQLADRGQYGAAADELCRTLLFEDRFMDRTRILLSVADLYRKGNEPEKAIECLTNALRHVCARPIHAELTHSDLKTSVAARIAVQMCEVWARQGLTPGFILLRARKLPHFKDSHIPPSHFRIGLYHSISRSDLLLEEAELLLRQEPMSTLARRARLTALDALGRSREVRMARKKADLLNAELEAQKILEQKEEAQLMFWRTSIAALLIFAVALVLRVMYVHEHYEVLRLDICELEQTDNHTFSVWAKNIAEGDLLCKKPVHAFHLWTEQVAPERMWNEWYGSELAYHQSPFYPYFIAAAYSLVGYDHEKIGYVQALFGALTCLLTFVLVKRAVSFRAGIIAGLLLAFYAGYYFYDAFLLRDGFMAFVTVVLALALEQAVRRGKWRDWLLAGCALGFFTLSKETGLALLFLTVGLLAWHNRRNLGAAVRPAGLVLLGWILVTSPAFARNVAVKAPTFKLSTRGPEVFVAGNAMGQDGVSWNPPHNVMRQILRKTDFSLPLTMVETLKTYRADPAAYMRLLWDKTSAFFNGYEPPNNVNFDMHSTHLPTLRRGIVSMRFLSAAALLGLLLGLARRRQLIVPYYLFFALIGSVIALYVIARFRLQAVPIMAVFAALTVDWTLNALRDKRIVHVAIVALLFWLLADWCKDTQSFFSDKTKNFAIMFKHVKIGNLEIAKEFKDAHLEFVSRVGYQKYDTSIKWKLRDIEDAFVAFDRALALPEDSAERHLAVGTGFANLTRVTKRHEAKEMTRFAMANFNKALDINPTLPGVYSAMGSLMEKLGKHFDALLYYSMELDNHPRHTEALRESGLIYFDRGLKIRSLVYLERAIKANDWSPLTYIRSASILGDPSVKYAEIEMDDKSVLETYSPNRAEERARQAVQWAQNDPQILKPAAKVFYAKGALHGPLTLIDEAITLLERIIKIENGEILLEDGMPVDPDPEVQRWLDAYRKFRANRPDPPGTTPSDPPEEDE